MVYNILKEMGIEYNPGPPLSSPNNNMASRQESADSQAAPTNPNVQLVLGENFYQKKDYEKAAYWFEKAAEQGLADAQLRLAFMYMDGEGVTASMDKALYWSEKAAMQGFDLAQTQTGVLYSTVKGDSEKAIYWWKKAAAQGEETAIEMLEQLEKNEN